MRLSDSQLFDGGFGFLLASHVLFLDVQVLHLRKQFRVLIMFYQEYREDIREADSEKVVQAIVNQVEQFWLAHKELPNPESVPTPDKHHQSSGD
jgi:hypothetical protein